MLEKCYFESTISYGEYNDIYDPFLTFMPNQLFERIFQKIFFHVIQYPRNSPQKNFHRKIPKKNHIKYAPFVNGRNNHGYNHKTSKITYPRFV